MTPDLRPRLLAELLGTALLVVAVVGSGIAAGRLAPGQAGLELLVNALSTAGVLVGVLAALGPVSGAHVNPVVTLAGRAAGELSTWEAVGYIGAQVAGGAIGSVVANLMFSLPAVALSTTRRSSGGLWLAEAVATFGLLLVVLLLGRSQRGSTVPYAVAAYIGGAYFFTASTSFANPAVTLARTLSDTFSGIAPASAPAFVLAQLAGAALAVVTVKALCPAASAPAVPADENGASRARRA